VCRGGPLNKENYLQIVRSVLGRHVQDFSTEKLDLVFRTLDSNRDGFLDESELERVSQELLTHGCAVYFCLFYSGYLTSSHTCVSLHRTR
jgi:hypothetical protein